MGHINKQIIVIGGGISGLITAIGLCRAGIPVTLIEKKGYPMHRVCGEYISREVIPFLKAANLYPEETPLPQLTRFQLTSVNGHTATIPLKMGGFGISRYTFDEFLYRKALKAGVKCLLYTEVTSVAFQENQFLVDAGGNRYVADIVIGSYGKRSRLDIALKRGFIQQKSPYVGVKYHIKTDHPDDLIALHNFKDGYCGISNIEEGKTNLCYLTHRNNLRQFGNIQEMERAILYRNPFLKTIFTQSHFLFDKPETINEISFATKGPVENHILMTGDAAGMITPLCGNGMAMAIRSANLLTELIIALEGEWNRTLLENQYKIIWEKTFAGRLWTGRTIQKCFGREWTSNLVVELMKLAPEFSQIIIEKTHGRSF